MYQQLGKNLLSSNISTTCPHNMVNFGPLAAEICWRVYIVYVIYTPANFNGFCVLAALLHGSQVVGVSQTLRRWTEGATYIRQGGHHVGHWSTFLVIVCSAPVFPISVVIHKHSGGQFNELYASLANFKVPVILYYYIFSHFSINKLIIMV